VKFLIDMPLSPERANWLRHGGHDAVHAAELGLHQAPDAVILAQAKFEMRTVVTGDLDYPQLLALSCATEPSVILFRDGDWSDADVIARMADVLTAIAEADVLQSILVVERSRIRRRRLPL
jgi:predicted nuclease of predicted toxin-antitoxin system